MNPHVAKMNSSSINQRRRLLALRSLGLRAQCERLAGLSLVLGWFCEDAFSVCFPAYFCGFAHGLHMSVLCDFYVLVCVNLACVRRYVLMRVCAWFRMTYVA